MADPSSSFVYYGALVAAGLTSGFAGGLFGIGGGLLRVPIFLYLFPAFGVVSAMVFHMAAGTSLALAVPTSIASAWRQHRSNNLDLSFLKTWIPALVVGVGLGIAASTVSPTQVLKGLFLGLLVFMALYVALPARPVVFQRVPGGLLRGLMATIIGGVSTLLGLSGGVLTTPVLVACGTVIQRAVAISSAGSLAISIVAAAGMIWTGAGVPDRMPYSLGFVDMPAFAIMTPLVMLSAPLGVRVANRISARKLEIFFTALLLALAGDMAWDLVSGH